MGSMTSATEKLLAEIEGRAEDGRAECSVCLSPVIHHCGDEGTQSYERVVSRTDIAKLVSMLKCAREALGWYGGTSKWIRKEMVLPADYLGERGAGSVDNKFDICAAECDAGGKACRALEKLDEIARGES